MIEGGQSVTLNTNYKITNKDHGELFNLGIATVFRDDEDDHLPKLAHLVKAIQYIW